MGHLVPKGMSNTITTGPQSCLTLGVGEVNDVPILLHHIHLLDARNIVHAKLLQIALQLLVIRGRLMNDLLLSPRRAL